MWGERYAERYLIIHTHTHTRITITMKHSASVCLGVCSNYQYFLEGPVVVLAVVDRGNMTMIRVEECAYKFVYLLLHE